MTLPTRGGRPLRSIWLPGMLLLLLPGCGRHQDAAPRSPEESLQSMQIHPDFRVEMFASEPEVVDPVEMAFDARGRIFVAERGFSVTGRKAGPHGGGSLASGPLPVGPELG